MGAINGSHLWVKVSATACPYRSGVLRLGGCSGGSELEFAAEGGAGGIDAAVDAAEHNPYG